MIRFYLVKNVPLASWLFANWIVSNLYEFLIFLAVHRRIPRFARTGYLNDLLFRLRATEDDLVLRSFTSDKEFAKTYIRGLLGDDLAVPTLGVIRDAGQIDGYRFPSNSVVKPTHMSGQVVFVGPDGRVSEAERSRMKVWMTQNFGVMTGERHYLRLRAKIIIEPWLKLNGDFCDDFKLHVYRGEVRLVEVAVERINNENKYLYFDRNWGRLNFISRDYEPLLPSPGAQEQQKAHVKRPELFSKMLAVAEAIGRQLEYVRVDLYTDRGQQLYVGEISHISANARERFVPVEAERLFITGGLESPAVAPTGAAAPHGARLV